MPRKKKSPKITGGFVSLQYQLLDSEAWKSLSPTARSVFIGFKRDLKNGHQSEVSLTLGQAQKRGICQSPSTFLNAKKELVEKGFLDPCDPGGLNRKAVFELSNRWKFYNTGRFEIIAYKPGVGSKYFQTAMKDEDRKSRIFSARHGKT